MSDGPVEMPVSQSPGKAADSGLPTAVYTRPDWIAGGIAGAVALAGYLWTLAPGVTLEDSGEFITAAYQLGVPRPPGYPIWTLCAWLWCHLIPFGSIAWRINLMSAFASALACGLAALLVSSSGRLMVGRVGFMQAIQNRRSLDLIIMGSSICAGLLLAFCPVMWSQALITEVYGPDAFCLMVVLVLLYRWSFEPHQLKWLYLAALIWGVGLTAHQTLVLLTVAVPTFIWFIDRKLGRDLLVPILLVILGAVLYLIVTPGSLFHEGGFSQSVFLGIVIGVGFWLRALWRQGPSFMGRWPHVLFIYGAVLVGLSLYAYLFVSSCTNPPMNWGHCSQWDGFGRHFTAVQYDKVHTERTPLHLWGQFNMFFDDLQAQFNILFALLALLVLFFFRDLDERDRSWMRFLFIAFLCLGLGYLFLSNPAFDKQKQFTDRVFFLPCHCIYSLWIGYGLMLGLGYALAEKPDFQKLALPATILVALLPVASVVRNWAHQEQRGHNFGYRFGYLMFKPGGDYPEMDRNAILYGGTDPGRFVPTYMIFVESVVSPSAKTRIAECPDSGTFDRRDVFIITQNALAAPTYREYLRDQYDSSRPRLDDPATLTNRSAIYRSIFGATWKMLGRDSLYPADPIWIPNDSDAQEAVARYVDELRTRQPQPGEEVEEENGHVKVTGLAGVMAVNGMLTRDVFHHNKDRHAFYVEESNVIPWMYPYLEPFGIIMKLNKDPLPAITPEMVARDKAYWDALSTELFHDPKFLRDLVAQKTYSKLRSAIGGLYAVRQMQPEAEYAFNQARELCPDSPEGNFRLAQLYVDQRRFDDARNVLASYQKRDPYNASVQQALEQIKQLNADVAAIADLEKQVAGNPGRVDLGMQLAKAYATAKRLDQLDTLINVLVGTTTLSENDFLILVNFDAQLNRGERVLQLLSIFTQRYPKNPLGWFNLAMVLSLRGNCSDGMAALEKALALDSPDQHFHILAQRDHRLANCQNSIEYQRLLPRIPTASSSGNPQSTLPFKIVQ